MHFLIWIIVGGLIGWFSSIVVSTGRQQGLLPNVIVGILGAVLGGWLISPMLGMSTINHANFSAASLVVAFIGALSLLALVRFFKDRRAT